MLYELLRLPLSQRSGARKRLPVRLLGLLELLLESPSVFYLAFTTEVVSCDVFCDVYGYGDLHVLTLLRFLPAKLQD